MVGDTIQQCASQTLRSERFGPFVKRQVACDQGGSALVALRDQFEQQLCTSIYRIVERSVRGRKLIVVVRDDRRSTPIRGEYGR